MKRSELARTTPLRRSSPLPRGETPIKKQNAKRKGHRFPKGVDEALREFVRSLDCCVCNRPRPSHAHHVRTRGAGGADRDNLTPLCPGCHNELHRIGRRSFARKYGWELTLIAKQVTEAFDSVAPASPGSAHVGAPTP